MDNKYQSFEELRIWEEGMEICYLIYDALEDCRDFGLRNQMERSSVSIPSNIAEGYELNSNRGFIRHLLISKGSAGELRTQLYVAMKRNYISKELGDALLLRLKVESGMMQKFITARRKRLAVSAINFAVLFFLILLTLLPFFLSSLPP